MKVSAVQKAVLAIIIANCIWGGASPIFKLSLQNIPPFTLAFWRFFLGALILSPFLHKKIAYPIRGSKDSWLHIANTLSGITFNILFFFLGLRLTQAINAPVIASAAPIMTLIFAGLILREKFSLRKASGMLLGTLGILFIVLEPFLTHGEGGSVVGNVFLILATVGYVVSVITGKELYKRYDPVILNWWGFVIGATSFLPLAVYEFLKNPGLYGALDIRGYTGIVYGAVFSTAIAYTFFAWGLSKISATDTVMFTYIDPVAGAVLSVLLLHEGITPAFILGAMLIFGGIFLAEGKIHFHPFHKLIRRPDNDTV